MTLQEVWMVIARRWKLVVAVLVVCLLACGAWLMLSKPDEASYAATTYIDRHKRCAWVNLHIMGRETSVKLGLEILRKA